VFPHATSLANGSPFALAAIGATAGLAIRSRGRFQAGLLVRALLAAFAGAAAMFLFGQEAAEPALGIAAWAVMLALFMASGQSGWRWVAIAGAAAGAFLLARFVSHGLYAGQELTRVPPFVRAAFGGAGFGLIIAVGNAARHLSVRIDPARTAYETAKPKLKGELSELAERAFATHLRIEEVLEARAKTPETVSAQIRDASAALITQICHIGTEWQEIETEGERVSEQTLTERLASLDAKIEKTTDSIAKEQYGIARTGLAEQLKALGELATGRERVVARTHAHLTALEKLRFAVLNHRSVDAQRLASAVGPLLEEIRALSSEIDIASQAKTEAEAEAEAARAAAKQALIRA
jgi:hypothetical protein